MTKQAHVSGTIKPLVWEDFDGWGAKASAMLIVSYLIRNRPDGRFEITVSVPGYSAALEGARTHPALEVAKAAAQADYEARILAAIEDDPEAFTPGLRRAVQICKQVRNRGDLSEDEICGALECVIAIMDEVNALPDSRHREETQK